MLYLQEHACSGSNHSNAFAFFKGEPRSFTRVMNTTYRYIQSFISLCLFFIPVLLASVEFGFGRGDKKKAPSSE